MNSYIESLHNSLKLARSSTASDTIVVVVVGNQACDLDSVVGALVHAHLNIDSANSIVLPLIQCKRDEFRLRSDTRAALRRINVDLAFAERELLFLHDDISLDDLRLWHESRRLELVLVDHNRCTLPAVGGAVRQVIDHHVDERQHADESLQFKWIRTVGSCCTLVAQLAAHRIASNLDDATLLLTTIITDTINFDPNLKRATPLDETIARFLFTSVGSQQQQSFEQFSTIVFQDISQAKNGVSALTPLELLSRDFKSVDGAALGFSSITLPLAEFASKANLSQTVATLEQFCQSQQIDTLVICVAVTEPTFRRQLALFSVDNGRFEKLVSFLNQSNLQLAPILLPSPSSSIAFWDQGDRTASRKQVLPLISSAVNLS